MKIVLPISLDDKRDADIIRWLNQQHNKSLAVRLAVRDKIQNGVTLADIYREIQELKRRSFVAAAPIDGVEEPSEAATNLDKLLEL